MNKSYNIKISKKYIENPDYKKNLIVFLYLFQKESRNGNIEFSVNDIIDYWGYQRTNKQGEIPDKLKECLNELKKDNILNTNIDFTKIAHAEKVNVSFNLDSKGQYMWLSKNSNFCILTNNELQKLKNCKKKYSTHIDKLISLYLLIKSFMNMSETNPYSFCSFENIIKMNNISKNTFNKMLNILKQENLLFTYTEYYITKFKSLKMCQIFTLKDYTNDVQNFNIVKNNIASKLYDFEKWNI